MMISNCLGCAWPSLPIFVNAAALGGAGRSLRVLISAFAWIVSAPLFLPAPIAVAQNMVVDSFCYPPAQSLAGDVISAKVLSCIDTAQSRFLCRGGEAVKVSRHSCQRFGGHVKGKLVAEVEAQHGRSRFADCAMRSGVRRIGSGLYA